MEDNISALPEDANSSATVTEICASHSMVTFQYYTWGVVANIIAVYGLIGNILSIIVLHHCQMRNSTSYYLISLAIYDILVLLSMVLFMSLPTIYLEKNVMQNYFFAYKYMHPFVYPVALIAQTGTVYTTLACTVERYIAVCRPLHAANTCTLSRTKRVIFIIFFCSITYNIPRFLEYKTIQVYDSFSNTTVPEVTYTDLGMNKTFQRVYFVYSYLLFMFLLPFGIISILNILLIRAVNNARLDRNVISASVSKEKNLTVMLIVLINTFLACQLPALFDNIIFTISDQNKLRCSVAYVEFTTISNLLVVVNSAINFMLYCIVGKRFRHVFLKIFNLRKQKPRFRYTTHESSLYLRQRVNGYGTRVYDYTSSLL
ncbi:hypothetical protein ACJMK2_010493 [Sinanodonta woodiana]|uniref:G-protein coupled receptors family 1 profile domain-containing protein n=1 Tax=Sinanodonta woodiana TaxID=1069815 RepID=A0ABD3VFJ0_SINWO